MGNKKLHAENKHAAEHGLDNVFHFQKTKIECRVSSTGDQGFAHGFSSFRAQIRMIDIQPNFMAKRKLIAKLKAYIRMPVFCIIRPFILKFFTISERYHGEICFIRGKSSVKVKRHGVHKETVFRFLGIPIFKLSAKISDPDWHRIEQSVLPSLEG